MPDIRENLIEILRKTRYEYRRYIAMKDYEKRMAKTDEEFCVVDDSIVGEIPFCADHLIANSVTIQRWIPVTERLPEDDLPKDRKVKRIKVLVAYRTNGNWIVRTQVRAKGYWYSEPDKWDWIKESDPITHWMPLPDAPKGDD